MATTINATTRRGTGRVSGVLFLVTAVVAAALLLAVLLVSGFVVMREFWTSTTSSLSLSLTRMSLLGPMDPPFHSSVARIIRFRGAETPSRRTTRLGGTARQVTILESRGLEDGDWTAATETSSDPGDGSYPPRWLRMIRLGTSNDEAPPPPPTVHVHTDASTTTRPKSGVAATASSDGNSWTSAARNYFFLRQESRSNGTDDTPRRLAGSESEKHPEPSNAHTQNYQPRILDIFDETSNDPPPPPPPNTKEKDTSNNAAAVGLQRGDGGAGAAGPAEPNGRDESRVFKALVAVATIMAFVVLITLAVIVRAFSSSTCVRAKKRKGASGDNDDGDAIPQMILTANTVLPCSSWQNEDDNDEEKSQQNQKPNEQPPQESVEQFRDEDEGEDSVAAHSVAQQEAADEEDCESEASGLQLIAEIRIESLPSTSTGVSF